MVHQISCSVLGCHTGGILPSGDFKVGPYLTDPDNETVDQRQVDLQDHVKMVHEFAREEALNTVREANSKVKLQTEQYKAET